jgi:hypothetical protein
VESGGLQVECDQLADGLAAILLGLMESPLLLIQLQGLLALLLAFLPDEDVQRGV